MVGLLGVFGRAIAIDTPELIWHWLDEHRRNRGPAASAQDRHLDQIIDLMAESRNTAAEEQLRLYLFEHPSCCFARLAAAALYVGANNLHAAIEQLNSVYMRHPNNTLALYVLGYCYERLGYEAEAIEFYQDCLKFKDYLQLPAQRLAAIYLKNGRLEEAITEYESLKQHYPDDVCSVVSLGHLHLAAQNYDKAIETFNMAILIHPDNFAAPDDSLEQLVEDQAFEEAMDLLETMLVDQPERPDLIAKQADILSMMGETTDAIARYQEALRICPNFLEATIRLGTAYLKTGAEQLAAQQFNMAVEINDTIVEAYLGLAAAQKLAGSPDQATNTLSLAAAIQPNSTFLFAETAKLILKAALDNNLVANPEHGESLDEIVLAAHQRHLEMSQNNPDLHYRLGVLYMNAGRYEDAAACFNFALQINPTFSRAAAKLAVCLFETGRVDEAMKRIMPVAGYDSATLDLYYKTALLYCDRIKFASSLINMERQIDANLGACIDPAVNISIVLQNMGLSDPVGLMWENLCQTAGHAQMPESQA
jgi:tetratricopeptide (TPR) repeat protein